MQNDWNKQFLLPFLNVSSPPPPSFPFLREFTSNSHQAGSPGDDALANKVLKRFKEYGIQTWTDEHFIKIQEAPAPGLNKVVFKGREERPQGFLSYSATGTTKVNYKGQGSRAEDWYYTVSLSVIIRTKYNPHPVRVKGLSGLTCNKKYSLDDFVISWTTCHTIIYSNGFKWLVLFQGAVLYAHYGQESDFRMLQGRNINLSGRVILVRAGKISFAEKVSVPLRRRQNTWTCTFLFLWLCKINDIIKGALYEKCGFLLICQFTSISLLFFAAR